MTRISDLQGTNLFNLFLVNQIPYLYYAQEYILYLAMTSLSPGLWKIESNLIGSGGVPWLVSRIGLDNNRDLSYLEMTNLSITKEIYLTRDYDDLGNLNSIQFISIDPNRDLDLAPARIDIDGNEIKCIPKSPETYLIRSYSVDEHLRISSDKDKFYRLSKSISVIENMWGTKIKYSPDLYETSSFRITVSEERGGLRLITTDTSSVIRVVEEIRVIFRKETT